MSRVLALTSDLFLQSRITELARSLNHQSKVVTTCIELVNDARSSKPGLVVLDLASFDYDAFTCASELKRLNDPPRILAIFPHVRTDLKLKAEKAMIDYIVPNSSFLRTMKSILEKEVRGK
jgi:DNA-binding response OmpR family regulator